MAICLTLSCKQRSQQVQMDESAFVFGTEHIDGDAADYSRPAVIMGHIANREVYAKTQEISLVIPFYDRVSDKQTSAIYDDRFAFSLSPYAPRTISMPPYVAHMVVCPGDSIHVELDFADLAKVVYSGDVPGISINGGKPRPPDRLACVRLTEDACQDALLAKARDHGLWAFSIGITHRFQCGDGSFDFSDIDRLVRHILSIWPEAYFYSVAVVVKLGICSPP